MVITVSRVFLIALAAVFSAYHVFLGISTLSMARHPSAGIVALALYSVGTIVTLSSPKRSRLPLWIAMFTLAVCLALPLLVTSQLNPAVSNGYGTWHIAAVGTLMTIVAVRRRQWIAWFGVGFLVLHTVLWTGNILSLGTMGVVGSVVWVGVAVVLARGLAAAARDTNKFLRAERQAALWQAAQEAHLSERQHRLAHTYHMAAPLMTEIVRSCGNLTLRQREECRLLEASMRDEIRGRRLLNDRVRREVMAARRRGCVVTLLDEGGLDDVDDTTLESMLDELAVAVRGPRVDTMIVRTVQRESGFVITVVGLRTPNQDADAASTPMATEDDDVELWLEISRPVKALQG